MPMMAKTAPFFRGLILILFASVAIRAESWPYNRYHGKVLDSGVLHANTSHPEFEDDPQNHFLNWFHSVVKTHPKLQCVFVNGSIPHDLKSFDHLIDHFDLPSPPDPADGAGNGSVTRPMIPTWPLREATELFSHLGFPLDPKCASDKSKWYYRMYDGSCNWLKMDEVNEGQYGMAKARDYNQHSFADGISAPREGPNPRAISNAFFKRKQRLYYEHTPLLLGLIEFIIHDISYSLDSTTESISVPMPPDEDYFHPNTTFEVWRTAPVPGTGTSKDNPRENVNMATTWLDISALYGSTREVATALRSHSGGKLLTQELVTRGRKTKASYLPFNTMDVPMRTRPGVSVESLFAGGDPRTNEDWVVLAVHTLLLREHNRLCDILAKRHPEFDDEKLYQTTRLIMAAKYALIANSYQMAYWTDKMPWPRDDGFPLYRQMYGEGFLDINPANSYPWPLVTKAGRPMVVSAEMGLVYRFHEFIIPSFPIKDALNETIWDQDLFSTGFNSSGFIDSGLENILRGMVSTHIPNFKSGVDEAFRSAGKYRGQPFDVATWSVVHEREQGLPTFNVYFRAYNGQDPSVVVPIRKTFEDFSSDPEMVASLKKHYETPDDVDLVVGVQLDEEMFPGTTVPKSALIISLFSLFGMGNSDRFSVGFAMMRCFLVDTPWDCHPSNALEEILWAPKPLPGFPNARFYDTFWMTEMDFQAHGTNLLWRIVTENTDINCLQAHPLFPMDPVTNPILCALPQTGVDYEVAVLSGVEVALELVKLHIWEILAGVAALVVGVLFYLHYEHRGQPPVLYGWPVLGKAIQFQKDPKDLLLSGLKKYGNTPSSSFGIKLASLKHFVLTKKADLQMLLDDNAWEAKFSLHGFLAAINFSMITQKENFDSDLHTKLIRTHFGDPETVAKFGYTIEAAAKAFLDKYPLVMRGEPPRAYNSLNEYLSGFVTYVVSRCMVGEDSFDNKELLQTFKKFNSDAINAMGLASLLPTSLQFLAASSINHDYKVIRKILMPVISLRRSGYSASKLINFLDFILPVTEDDQRAADLVAVMVWGGLTNIQSTFASTFLDIISTPHVQDALSTDLKAATPGNLNTFTPQVTSPWQSLRSAMLESVRLCGSITGPARLVSAPKVPLASDPSQHLAKGDVATLSAYYTHRSTSVWGADAGSYQPTRFAKGDPPIGSPIFITWGLKGPHMCPGRWFAQVTIQVMVKALVERYQFDGGVELKEEDRYIYSSGSVDRKPFKVSVRAR